MSTRKIRLPKPKFGKKTGYLLLVIALVLVIHDPVGSAHAVRNVFAAFSIAFQNVGGGR